VNEALQLGKRADKTGKTVSIKGRRTMPDTAESRLAALGLTLPEAPQPVANYVPTLVSGDLLFISGQISKNASGHTMTGCLGSGPGHLTIADGEAAAKLCALNILAQAKAALGSLERVGQVLRLTGFVTSSPGFSDQPKVINGASDLMVAVLGDRGRHTRSAVGVAALPVGAAVEIDAIIKVT
jgi:enamine deaminase RidA (YjgF/YER057c/UK114 family)